MSNLQRRVLWCAAVFGIAAAAAAQETSIQLPPDNPVSQLKAGPGDDAVRSSCTLCHSTDYIVRQPRLDAQRWDAEVKKMVTVYGARISDADARIIADYLARSYGADGAEPKKPSPER
jgi:cytochrome c5